tara:strand:- start:1107 stop:1265 length:159 start_codon:yes stop_codon:yes gene_type:complete
MIVDKIKMAKAIFLSRKKLSIIPNKRPTREPRVPGIFPTKPKEKIVLTYLAV